MSTLHLFHLPDLGEGLPDAEIVEWHVAVGQVVKLDEPLVSMETAKAVVDLPAPCSGTLVRWAGKPGDVITTGAWLAEFELDASLPQRAAGHDTGHSHGPTPAAAPPAKPADEPAPAAATPAAAEDDDAGTVVGAMQVSSEVRREALVAVGGVKAMPAVRAMAKKLGVDLARVSPSGADGVATLADVRRAAAEGQAAPRAEAKAPQSAPAARAAPPTQRDGASDERPARVSADAAFDTDAPIRGVRRNMLRTMAAAHAEVVPTTLMDDADLHAWAPGQDITVRLVRAIARAAAVEPAMNAWLNAKEGTLRRHARVDVGIAIDHPDGLFVANLRGADRLDAVGMRAGISHLRDGLKDRSLPPDELSGYTIMLSNFGKFAGKYATPVVVPPCVCIVAAGRLYHGVVPVLGGIEAHRLMPLSLTFDHRAATGGEAARFLKVLIDDLQRSN